MILITKVIGQRDKIARHLRNIYKSDNISRPRDEEFEDWEHFTANYLRRASNLRPHFRYSTTAPALKVVFK